MKDLRRLAEAAITQALATERARAEKFKEALESIKEGHATAIYWECRNKAKAALEGEIE
jgi:hypothetical protein